MKKFIVMLSFLMMFGGTVYAAEPTDPGDILGNVGGFQSDPYKAYLIVRYVSNEDVSPSLVSGDVVVWSSVSGDGVSIERTRTSADEAIAGIVVSEIESSDNSGTTTASDDNGRRNWGYIQVYGRAIATLVSGGDNASAAGDFFITSSDPANITGLQELRGEDGVASGVTADVASITSEIRAAQSSGGYFINDPSGKASTDIFIRLQ